MGTSSPRNDPGDSTTPDFLAFVSGPSFLSLGSSWRLCWEEIALPVFSPERNLCSLLNRNLHYPCCPTARAPGTMSELLTTPQARTMVGLPRRHNEGCANLQAAPHYGLKVPTPPGIMHGKPSREGLLPKETESSSLRGLISFGRQ